MPARHLRVFESYRRRDAAEVALLQQSLRLRGLRTWRDVNDLHLGGATEDEIRRGIQEETDAFVLYATKSLYQDDSAFIWEKELPWAIARWKAGNYPLAVLFRETEPAQLSAWCATHDLEDLGRLANGAFVPLREPTPEGHDPVVHALAVHSRKLLSDLLEGVPARERERLSLVLRTFVTPDQSDGLVLDLDWRGVLESARPPTWNSVLFTALEDVADVIRDSNVSEVRAHVQSRLTGAVALGMATRRVTNISIRVFAREGEWLPRPEAALFDPQRAGDECHPVAVVSYGVNRRVRVQEEQLAARVGAGRLIRFEVPEGIAVHEHSRALAEQVGIELRALSDSGVRDFHVLLAGPAALGFLIGRELNALGRVHIYYADAERDAALAFTRSV